MPRIDPLQLLKCLSVLLAPNGGIKSKEEVQRLASLMTKFSKKLVSKCIYIQILRATECDLLDLFMTAGGWNLVHMWLSDAVGAKNWPLLQELLSLLSICPVTIERLKANNCPKLIKGLTKDGECENVKSQAVKIVEKWMKVVKGGTQEDEKEFSRKDELNLSERLVEKENEVSMEEEDSKKINDRDFEKREELSLSERLTSNVSIKDEVESETEEDQKPKKKGKKARKKKNETESKLTKREVGGRTLRPRKIISLKEDDLDDIEMKSHSSDGTTSEESNSTWDAPEGQLPVYKITIRDGKQVLAKVCSSDRTSKSEKDDSDISIKTEGSEVRTEDSAISDASVGKVEEKVKDVLDSSSSTPASSESGDNKNKDVKIKNEKDDKTSSGSEREEKKDRTKNKAPGEKSINKLKTKESSKEKEKHLKNKSKDKVNEKSKSKVVEQEKGKDSDREKSKDKIKENDNAKKSYKDTIAHKQYEKDRETYAKLMNTPSNVSKLAKIPKKAKPSEISQKSSEVSKGKDIKKLHSSNDAKKTTQAEVNKPERKPVPPPEIVRKPLPSFEIRKPPPDAPRPKTVKTFNSKFRSTGLEEEVKPPPPRVQKKPVSSADRKATLDKAKLPSLKRPSPPRELFPPDKKIKTSISELEKTLEESKKNDRQGGIKLIAPKPKPSVQFLQESDVFMDALTAGSKVEPRKRKRRTSSSKDGPEPKKEVTKEEESKPSPPTSPKDEKPLLSSPPPVKPSFKFYQDTLESEEEKQPEEEEENPKNETEKEADPENRNDGGRTPTPTPEDDEVEEQTEESNSTEEKSDSKSNTKEGSEDSTSSDDKKSMKGVLVYHKAYGKPKKSVRWKEETALEDIMYFELDETERVNVTKTFMDMKQMERSHEREAFEMARKLAHQDVMEEKIAWQPLVPIDLTTALVDPGKSSREKEVQYAREKTVLQALYFTRTMIPDSPGEPDPEIHAPTDPVQIPLDDATGNTDSVYDFQNTPWPEPKPMLIPNSPEPPLPTALTSLLTNINAPAVPLPPQQRPLIPVAPGGGDWRTGDGKVLTTMQVQMDMFQGPNPMANMPPPTGMPEFPLPPEAGGFEGNFEGNFEDFNMPFMEGGEEDVFEGGEMGLLPNPPGFPMMPMGPRPGLMPFRGNARGRGNMGPVRLRGRGPQGGPRGGPWFRGAPPQRGRGNWQRGRGGQPRGRGPQRHVCGYFQNGYCRHGEGCQYLHPGVNGPQVSF